MLYRFDYPISRCKSFTYFQLCKRTAGMSFVSMTFRHALGPFQGQRKFCSDSGLRLRWYQLHDARERTNKLGLNLQEVFLSWPQLDEKLPCGVRIIYLWVLRFRHNSSTWWMDGWVDRLVVIGVTYNANHSMASAHCSWPKIPIHFLQRKRS